MHQQTFKSEICLLIIHLSKCRCAIFWKEKLLIPISCLRVQMHELSLGQVWTMKSDNGFKKYKNKEYNRSITVFSHYVWNCK